MYSKDDHTAALLAALRDEDPPSESTIDLDLAMRSGRRTTRVRSATAMVAAAAATAVAVLVVPAVIRTGQGEHPAVSSTAVQAEEYDVMSMAIDVGSAGGFTPTAYQTGRYQQRVYLRLASDPDSGLGAARAVVTVYARGHLPVVDGSPWTPGGEEAPAVNGRPAFYQSEPVTGTAPGTEIAWEIEPDIWAFAFLDGTGDDLTDRAHYVAQSVSPGALQPVAAPFTLPSSTVDGLGELVGVISSVGTPDVALLFSDSDPPAIGLGDATVVVGVTTEPTPSLQAGQSGSEPVLLDEASGLSAFAYTTTNQLIQIGGLSKMDELAGAVRLVGDPTDPTTWTGDPIR